MMKPLTYRKYPRDVAPALTAPDLAKLYDRAARQIELLYFALELCAPLTPRAEAARGAAFDAVSQDMKEAAK